MKYFITILSLIVMGILLGLAIKNYIKSIPTCISSHVEERHQKAYTSLVYTGKVFVPVHHPARDYEVTICDEYDK